MTQTALYSDKTLLVSLYKSALKRIKGVGLIYTLPCFIAFPMFFIMRAAEYASAVNMGYSYYGFSGSPEIYPTVAVVMYFAIVIVGAVFISVYSNSFMHNRRAVDVFHALPVKRWQLLVANYAAVLTVLFASQLLCYGTVIAVNAFTLKVAVAEIIAEALRVALLTAVIAAVAMLCSVCCNAALDSCVFSGAILVIVPAYTALIMLLMQQFIYGFDVSDEVLFTSFKFSPVVMLYQTFFAEEFGQGILLNLCYILAVMAAVALACLIYTRRKSEVAQSADVKNPLYQFIILATALGGGVFCGTAYSLLWGYRSGIVRICVISVMFTVAIYLIFNAVMSRNPKPSKMGLVGVAATAAVVVGLYICMDNGFFGVESYLPETDDVQSVTINYTGDYGNVSVVNMNSHDNLYSMTQNTVTFTDSQAIDMVRDIHSQLVNSIGQETECFSFALRLEYTLKNGRTVTRRYHSSMPVALADELVALEDLEQFKTQLYPVLYEKDIENVKGFEIVDGFENNYLELSSLTAQEKELLYNAIAQDTMNITRQMKDQNKGVVFARIKVNYKEITAREWTQEKQETVTEAAYAIAEPYSTQPEGGNYRWPIYDNVVFDVTQASINTINALKQLGLESYTTVNMPQNTIALVYATEYAIDYSGNTVYWRTNSQFDNSWFIDNFRYREWDRTVSYSDEQQLSQLAQNCKTCLYGPSLEKIAFAVAFIDKDADWRTLEYDKLEGMVYYMSYADAPDFVKQDLEAYVGKGNHFTYTTKLDVFY